MEWKNIYRGFLMGISDLIPGVSGGTIAFILGIYDRLLLAISGFFSREWKRHLGFLLPLGLGIGLTLLVFSRFIDFLLSDYPKPTYFFFLGLIIGVVPYISRQAGVRKNFKLGHFLLLLAVGAVLASTAFIKPVETHVITSLTLQNTVGLFFAGWAGSMAMLLPGVSGSFILLLLGVYATAINALSTLNVPVIVVIGTGVIVGFIVSSRVIHYLLKKFTHIMFAIIIGLIIGSIFVIYPGIPESGTSFVMSVIALITGLLVANIFNTASSTLK
jgi:putative membrane protein